MEGRLNEKVSQTTPGAGASGRALCDAPEPASFRVMDGDTPEGAWLVKLELSADQVEMLVRCIQGATMFSGSGKNSSGQEQDTMQQVAYREFLKGIITLLEQALEEQKP